MSNANIIPALNKLDEAIRELNAQGINVEYSMQKMKKQTYEVVVRETYTATISVKAISPSAAKYMVMEAVQNGMKCDFCQTPDIDISVWDSRKENEKVKKTYPCDGPEGFCPYDAEGGMDCYNLCGLGADNGEDGHDDDHYDEEE